MAFEGDQPRWSGRELSWLMSHKGVGPARALEVANLVPDPSSFRDVWPDVQWRLKSWATAIPAADPIPDTRFPDVECVGFFDASYPRPLSSIPSPPAVLWVRGQLPSFDRAVAVVGTRHPDEWGSAVAAYAARFAVELGAVVVSGLALGCDAIAHREAIARDGVTVAVLGGSLMRPSPAVNRALADEILARGGALVSEVSPDVDVSPRTLVQRNRLQSGLSSVTVIAQSGIPGGTLHTARFALEQRRRLVVGKPQGQFAEATGSSGNVFLAQDPVPSPSEIAEVLQTTKGLESELVRRGRIADATPVSREELFDALDRLMP